MNTHAQLAETVSPASLTQEPTPTLEAKSSSAANRSSFESLRQRRIDSLNIRIEEYRHRATGAMHYHLAADNPENVFLVALRTVPMDSTGVAHILEHTALCGSAKYPVRDPFFMMIRRSLNTFMNAFTASDWTAYPFASKNRKDFDNLLQVYLDAVFFSRLHELDFAQEGHRLEFSKPEDPATPLQYKGVVFNEMKGAMSSPANVLWQTLCKHLYPTTTYHYNSGGEPAHIPDLDYQGLKGFYRSHYQPGNAVFMTYGDIPAAEHHARFEELALKDFSEAEATQPAISVGDEQRLSKPLRAQAEYACEADNSPRTHVVTGWLLGLSTDLKAQFEAQLLSAVLLDNSSSPLMKALETSPLGQSPSPLCGLEDSNREMVFVAGLEGCKTDATDGVESLILKTLSAVEKNVPQEQVQAALHQLELEQREISGGAYPYGLQLILEGLPAAIHRGDPIELLDLEPVLAQLRQDIKDPGFIPGLIRRLLLDNPHRVTLTLRPQPELAEQRQKEEAARLAEIKDQLSSKQQAEIVQRSKALLARQASKDDPDILPKVGPEDIPPQISEPQRQKHGAAVFYAAPSNGIVYQQVVMPLPDLCAKADSELLEVLPFYTACISDLGIGKRDYAQVQAWQAAVSGGVYCSSSMRNLLDDEQQPQACVSFASKGLARNHQAFTELLHATLNEVQFDETARMQELIEQICTREENRIPGQGHVLAMGLACSRMSPAAQYSFASTGLEGISRLKAQREKGREDGSGDGDGDGAAAVLAKMARLHEQVLAAPKQFLLIAEEYQRDELLGHIQSQWAGVQTTDSPRAAVQLPSVREQVCEARTTATAVNFCAAAFPTVPAAHADNSVLHVLAGFLRNNYLHRAIREQGGAYGAGAGQDAGAAAFRFFSYRDPRLTETLADFNKAVDWMLNTRHEPRLLEEAILGVIATMDKPSSPAGEARKAYYRHLFGETLQLRMEFRQRVLAVTVDDLRRVAETYLRPEQVSIGVLTAPERARQLELPAIRVAAV